MEKIKIVCLGGSMEAGSSTLALLKFTVEYLTAKGAEVHLADIKQLNLPVFSYNSMNNDLNRHFKLLIKKIKEADGIIFASPEYHGTVSAAFKNVIDYFEILCSENPPYLTGKPVACIAVGGAENSGHSTLISMFSIVYNLRGIFLPSGFALGYSENLFDKNKKITGAGAVKKLKRMANELIYVSAQLKK